MCKNTKGITNRKRLRNTALKWKVRTSAESGLLNVAPEKLIAHPCHTRFY